ncbi:MAG: excinuclease ABC subunit UvrA [Armatimonadetes bacterium]|nr:excinuclease ABC subunit UvrA [Armatimonadota bacterium]
MVRQTIAVKGARENNLKSIDVEIPRDQLIVITGLSGSGKSSLAFDTIYAEGQRRFLESLSAWAKRFVSQIKKPDVDFVYGLSPVISIEQKTITKNPRSTIGTMTDIYDYLRLLYCVTGTAHCPHCQRELLIRTPYQMAEHLLSLPEGAAIEIDAPVSKIYGEDYSYLIAEVRTKGHRWMRVEDKLCDIGDEIELDEAAGYDLEAVVDKFVIRKDIDKQLQKAIENGLRIGEGFLRFRVLNPETLPGGLTAFYDAFACPEHRIAMGELLPYYFSFNEPESACVTCSGLGTYLRVHPDLLVPDKSRSIKSGAFIAEAFRYDKNTWNGRMMYSLAKRYGFSLDVPFLELSKEVIDILFYGTKGEKFDLLLPEGAAKGDEHIGKPFTFSGIINDIERRYRHYRRQGEAHTWMEEYLKKVMVEHACPDCRGAKLKKQRFLVRLCGKNIHELGEMNLKELRDFLENLPPSTRQKEAGEQIRHEIISRLDLLLGIGLDYLNLNRKSATLSGGESQRIRLSTQISSGLMGMLYVLDEPSIGLHPKDNIKLINTLQRLRDIGNTVIVVEHDEATIRAADYIVEFGPGPGVHGGRVVAQGSVEEILRHPDSLTGQYLSGHRKIEVPPDRRSPNGQQLMIRGARENNLQNIDVEIPLGLFICITGASGSGKSTLVNEILFKKLYAHFHDSRVLSGDHDAIEGLGHLNDVINIDQTPIGKTPRSNPATYIGFYDDIRRLFAATPEAAARGYTASRFSFNVKGGRCEECGGEGIVTTSLHFMPDVESPCSTCKGTRYNQNTLEVQYRGKNIADILDMTIEEGARFFAGKSSIGHKLRILESLGLGYLKLGQSSTTLSGGEAQRIKLAFELGKIKRGRNLYILDEPTTGLHLADIQRLLDCLNRLVAAGNTVVVIEHHMDLIKTADYIIDLGPEGGHNGGRVVARGTPEELSQAPHSHTGRYLKEYLAI